MPKLKTAKKRLAGIALAIVRRRSSIHPRPGPASADCSLPSRCLCSSSRPSRRYCGNSCTPGGKVTRPSVVFGTAGSRIHAGNDGSACWRADGCIGPATVVAQRPGGEPVEVRRDGIAVEVGAQLRADVLRRQPEDVRSRARGLGSQRRTADACGKGPAGEGWRYRVHGAYAWKDDSTSADQAVIAAPPGARPHAGYGGPEGFSSAVRGSRLAWKGGLPARHFRLGDGTEGQRTRERTGAAPLAIA